MEVQSNENAALLKLLKTKSRTKTELLKVSGARRVPDRRLWTLYWPKEKS
jgi:hypothetical protein